MAEEGEAEPSHFAVNAGHLRWGNEGKVVNSGNGEAMTEPTECKHC